MKAILFDVDDTLYDQLQPFQKAYEKNFDFPDVSVEKCYLLSRKYGDEIFHLSESGEIRMEAMHRYRIKKALADFEYEITSEKASKFQQTYHYYQQVIELKSTMRQALNYCVDKGVVLGIITNGPSEHQRSKIRQLQIEKWIPENHIFISSELGIAKPDAKLFHLVERKLTLDKSDTYFVGDSFQNDIIGAKTAGWKAIWINQRNHPNPLGGMQPDFIVDRKNSLMDVLKEIL